MQTLAKGFAADGCVLWETYSGLYSPPDPTHDRLLVMAFWFHNADRVYAVHDAFVDEHATGNAILSGETQMFPDLRTAQVRSFQADDDFKLRALLAAPVTFADGVRGAVTVCRCAECLPFDDRDRVRLTDLAPIVPQLKQGPAQESAIVRLTLRVGAFRIHQFVLCRVRSTYLRPTSREVAHRTPRYAFLGRAVAAVS